MTIKDLLSVYIKDFKIDLSDYQYEQLQKYYELLVEWNKKINLTAITDIEGVALKHFADSLTLFNYVDVPENSTLIDVGTGAGFPGIVLKIARPDIKLTLLDSLNKRLIFLQEVCDEIKIDAEIIHSRAEDGARKVELRENFDFAVSRAVAQLNILSEYCIGYVKKGGKFCALKGRQAEEEIKSAQNSINIMGGKMLKTFEFSLPQSGDERTIVVIEKKSATPNKYPRQAAKIKAKAL